MNEKKELETFRKSKIKEEPKNKVEEHLREEMIELERGNKSNPDLIKKCFYEIKDIIKTYIDMEEDYYTIISLWIIGTYFHSQFYSYPYLFFNAMRGSGKSRTVELITYLSKDGRYTASPTEAVLFRVLGTLGIDEFESIGRKDKSAVRELLNASYKKGIKVMRMKKRKTLAGEEQIVEEFEPYRPIVLANIWGMEEVLSDRCITLILEKSNHPIKTRLVQDFDINENIQNTKKLLNQCSLCGVVTEKNIYSLWNNYINTKYNNNNTTYNTHTTTDTHTQQTTPEKLKTIDLDTLFNKIDGSGLKGRSLELFLPLFFVAKLIDDFVLDEIIRTANKITEEKIHEEEVESIDVSVLDFISRQEQGLNFQSVKELTRLFREFIDDTRDWINPKWFGRALKRLGLVVDKRRIGRGVDVILNVVKAEEKIKMFRRKK